MSEAIRSTIPDHFVATPIRESGETMRAAPIWQRTTSPIVAVGSAPALPVSPLFEHSVFDLCDSCFRLLDPSVYKAPGGIPEAIVHFNETQTAFVNSAALAMYRLTGREEYKTNRAAALVGVLRLFLMTAPAAAVMRLHERPARIERDKAARASWAKVVEPSRGVDTPPVAAAEPGPEIDAGHVEAPAVGEVVSAVDGMYESLGDAGDLYSDLGGGDGLRTEVDP